MRPTDNQKRVIETLDGNVVVMAGAGSGKTTVLAHRFAQALASEVRGRKVPVDGILTITFTSKAAGEIAERVRRVVGAGISPEMGREVDRAWISTIHALCGRLLRRHVLEAGIDPSQAVADDATAEALSAEAYERAILRVVEADESAAELVEFFGVSTLRQMVTASEKRIRAMGLRPEDVVISWDTAGLIELRATATRAAREWESALEDLKQTPSVAQIGEYLRRWTESVQACDFECDAGLEEILLLCDSKAEGRAPNGTGEFKDALEECKSELRKALMAIHSIEVIDAVRALVAAYAAEYQDVKRRRGVLDYEDLQERALELLENEPGIAERYASQFSLVMVDEFQDTNHLQMRVLDKLTRGNLCAVGDANQSIYGWRFADVSIFRSLWDNADAPIPLMDNFRSHEKVLDFVNELFSMPHLFGPTGLERLNKRRLTDPSFPLAEEDPRVECVLVDNTLKIDDAVATEARALASRARELMDADSAMQPGDFAILLRAGKRAPVYAKAFEDAGFPVSLSAGAALFDAPEVAHVTSMLRAIAVPSDDKALLVLLASPLVGLSDDGLLAVSRASDGRLLWDGLKACADGVAAIGAEDRAAAVLCRDVIDYFGVRYGSLSLSDLVRDACEAFDFDIALNTRGTEGARAWANVLKIARMGDAYEATGSKDPARFAAYLELCREHSHENPAPAEASEESVRIMTIHASKGLEFPVVFVAGLHADKHHTADSVLVEQAEVEGVLTPRLAVRMPSGVLEGAHTPDYTRLKARQLAQDEEEEKRALYVACTRAKELLVLSGATDLSKDPPKGKRLIDWIREGFSKEERGVTSVGAAPVRLTLLEAEPREDTEKVAERGVTSGPLVAGGFGVVPAPGPARLPAAVSYSALHLYETCPLSFHARYALGMKAFHRVDESRATEVGSAAHARLQAWASGVPWDEHRQHALIRRFELNEGEVARVERALERYSASTIGLRAAAADRRQAEVAFRVALDETVLNGSIDLLAWEGRHALIVDYKTGRAPAANDTRRKAYQLQARCYALAALEGGAESVEVSFVFVEHDVEPIAFAYGPGDTPALKAGLNAIAEQIRTQPLKHLEVYEHHPCAACPALGTLCPLERPRAARRGEGKRD